MTDSPSEDPLYGYRQQQRENYEARNHSNNRNTLFQDDVYTNIQANDRYSSGRLNGSVPSDPTLLGRFFGMLRNKANTLSNFLVPSYSSFTTSESISTVLFFTVVGFSLFFLFLLLF
ncbi:non-specific serine/threonine protein kinase [Theileria orientalis]|uniref:Non-specific serine/threonine protein kinase n=1 Tax=Theileria orientalis TaxID=68886 RepID=A0A976SIR6_THEOR|nr:non-specific serine/threonine protein kinase [Theileria orientalis]